MGRTRLIRGNLSSPLTAPRCENSLAVVSGPEGLLAEDFQRIRGIKAAFLRSSFAARLRIVDGPAPRDMDVMVIGVPEGDAIHQACARVETAVHRPVNPTVFSVEEFAADSGFSDTVRLQSTVQVMGEQPWRSRRR